MTGPRRNPRLLEVPLYVAGKPIEAVQEELGLEDVVKLASNESCIGPSPLAVEAARRMLRQAHRYPGVSERHLRRKLSSYLGTGLTASNIVVGNGGPDVLHRITQVFVFDGGNTAMSGAPFPVDRISAAAFAGARPGARRRGGGASTDWSASSAWAASESSWDSRSRALRGTTRTGTGCWRSAGSRTR